MRFETGPGKAFQGRITSSRPTILYEWMATLILVRFLGLIDCLNQMVGPSIGMMVDYACFAMQIALCLICSGNTYMDLKLINIKREHFVIYLYLAFIFGVSMVIVDAKKEEFICCLRLLTTVSFGLWLTEHFEPNDFLEMCFRAIILIMGANVLFYLRHPSLAYGFNQGEMSFKGLYSSKNEAGSQLSFCFLVLMMYLRVKLDRKEMLSKLFWAMLALVIGLLLLAKATGAMMSAMIAGFYILVLDKRWGEARRLPMHMIFPSLQIGFLVFALTVIAMLEPFLSTLGKDATLTGRIPMWNVFIQMMTEKNTFFGYGYEWFWKDAGAMKDYHSRFLRNSWFSTMMGGCHNLLLELWVNTGLVGVAAFLILMVIGLRKMRYLRSDAYVFSAGYMILFSIHCLTERAMAPASFHTLFLFVSIGYACSAEIPPANKLHGKEPADEQADAPPPE